jgi:hypothetical protein
MSSEESDGEIGTQRNFKIRNLPWRDPDLTRWLHRVDSLPTRNAQNSRLVQRWISRQRNVSDLESTRKKSLTGLPINFYKSEWLMGQDRRSRARLNVDTTAFNLPKIDEFNH